MKGRVLVAGFTTRHVAQSAARAGYEVCAVDHFCDEDLAWYTKDRIKFEDLDSLPDAIDRMSKKYSFDYAIFTSGAEDLETDLPLCGTPAKQVRKFLDKLEMQNFFSGLGVPVPRLLSPDEFPAMVKPRRGAGGWRNAIVHTPAQLDAWDALYPDVPFIRQEVVRGLPASVCCICDGTRAKAIATNEQILRGDGESSFGFSGSITPCDHPLAAQMAALAEKIAAASGCVGTVGVDFVIGDWPYAIEINPRFQGTLDTVEAAFDCNLFQYHLDACKGKMPESVRQRPVRYSARSILFADRDFTLEPDLRSLAPMVADIPRAGTFFEKDQAVVSVYGTGPTRDDAVCTLNTNITTIRQYMRHGSSGRSAE